MAKGTSEEPKKLRIGFIHPDLGIGGAERLVVDAAVSLQNRGHNVTMFTSRHDPKRCFEETRNGTLKVHVLGSSLPRQLHPRFPMTIIFSILRSLLLTILLSASLLLPGPPSRFNPLSPIDKFDVFFVDQQSVCVPFLRLFTGTRVVFYCHFPDKLLSGGWEVNVDSKGDGARVGRSEGARGGSLLKRLYRWPIDKLEELTTGQSDIILSNSLFTSRVYTRAFPSLSKRPPRVVYPCIDLKAYKSAQGKGKAKEDNSVHLIQSDRPTLLSLNRFEAKKNVALAIQTYAKLRDDGFVPDDLFKELRLVIAGGYDDTLPDNIETLAYLRKLCDSLFLSHATITSPPGTTPPGDDVQVVFLLNFTTAQRTHLLTSANTLALLYTPANEHFGIVPIEAMACGLPVLAADSGGPTETIVDIAKSQDGTGYLLPPHPEDWVKALASLINMPQDVRERVANAGRLRVRKKFSLDTLGEELEVACRDALKGGADVHGEIGDRLIWFGAVLVGFAALNLGIIWWLYGGLGV